MLDIPERSHLYLVSAPLVCLETHCCRRTPSIRNLDPSNNLARPAPGFEPGTTSTRKRYHTTRPCRQKVQRVCFTRELLLRNFWFYYSPKKHGVPHAPECLMGVILRGVSRNRARPTATLFITGGVVWGIRGEGRPEMIRFA